MIQSLRALAALQKYLVQFPATMWWLTTIDNEIWRPLLVFSNTCKPDTVYIIKQKNRKKSNTPDEAELACRNMNVFLRTSQRC